MLLIGQFDSPFVRRTAVAMNHYGLRFERRVLSVFTNFESLLELNPLGKVPVLQLNDEELLFDSRYILDHLERQVSPERRLVPEHPLERVRVQRIDSVALGLAEKSYERGIEFSRRQPEKIDRVWVTRLEDQIHSALSWLDALNPDPWLYGNQMTQADITCAVAVTYLREKQPSVLAAEEYSALLRHNEYCESKDAFTASAYSRTEATQSGWSPSSE